MTIGKPFFDSVRASLFGGTLTQSQVDGLIGIAETWARSGSGDNKQFAYVLATPYHEVARTMQPIEEFGKGHGHAYGKPTGPYHLAYYGRGLVQLTFEDNYIKATQRLHAHGLFPDIDLHKNPELALRPDVAQAVLVLGMREGWFTGRKLSDYIGGGLDDFVNARRIINILDRAELIAGYAEKFLTAINL